MRAVGGLSLLLRLLVVLGLIRVGVRRILLHGGPRLFRVRAILWDGGPSLLVRRLLLLLLLGRVGGRLLRVSLGRLRRVLRLVLLLVRVLRVHRWHGATGRLGSEHRGSLRLHLDGRVVGRGGFVGLVPQTEGVAVEDQSRNMEKPGAKRS